MELLLKLSYRYVSDPSLIIIYLFQQLNSQNMLSCKGALV